MTTLTQRAIAKARADARAHYAAHGYPDSSILNPLTGEIIGNVDYQNQISAAYGIFGDIVTKAINHRNRWKAASWRSHVYDDAAFTAPSEVWAIRLQNGQPVKL